MQIERLGLRMNTEVWMSFIVAAIILCFSPGPTAFLVVGQALEHGKKSVFPLIAGTLTGDVIAMSFSFVGMGALLATSATLFFVLKWFGAVYLIFLGIKSITAKVKLQPKLTELRIASKAIYLNVLMVTALNPKGITFFLAFFPLFITEKQPVLPQMLILAVSFLTASAMSVSFYALSSGFLRSKMNTISFQRLFNKISGGVLISAGLLTATIQR